MASTLKEVTIYTDGACLGNPGPGGWAAILQYGGHRREHTGGARLTTNNRMELMAAIRGLEALNQPCHIVLFSDSEYVVKAMQLGWAKSWQSRGWRRGRNQAASNPDLWERLLQSVEPHEIEFQWVRGHHGNPENETADRLATTAARNPNLPPDEWYERNSSPSG